MFCREFFKTYATPPSAQTRMKLLSGPDIVKIWKTEELAPYDHTIGTILGLLICEDLFERRYWCWWIRIIYGGNPGRNQRVTSFLQEQWFSMPHLSATLDDEHH
ncbi:hypothetical protein HAX54_022362 [Datura stramonium]|uniref:Uncharacterized protein n=1 Tax=Datura stramonium TaxID=4076 RepID=A0ABS8UVD7_DATST|nr:hypothetical protein [Datura stramonium]